MELWFVAALSSALFGGIGAFSIKVAAHRNYHSSALVFTSSILTLIIFVPLAFVVDGIAVLTPVVTAVSFLSGLIISISATLKIAALRSIDSSIYFPLFKVASPFLAVIFGIVLFQESFTNIEWVGLILSLIVPLLLISAAENSRQTNLRLGLVLIGVTAVLTTMAAVLQKYATGLGDVVFWVLLCMQAGVLVGSGVAAFIKKKTIVSAEIFTRSYMWFISWRAVSISIGVGSGVYAYGHGGPLGIVYTINSLYILIPIILSIIFYNEHWNARKVTAIILSIAALALLH